MATYAFAMPIPSGKSEELKRYIQEMNGPRRDDYRKSSQKMGLDVERFWLQHTPDGDMLIVYWEADNPTRVFELALQSNDPFDQWFREKVIQGIFNIDASQPIAADNELISDYHEQRAGEKKFEEARKR